jgi:hypothetical protein
LGGSKNSVPLISFAKYLVTGRTRTHGGMCLCIFLQKKIKVLNLSYWSLLQILRKEEPAVFVASLIGTLNHELVRVARAQANSIEYCVCLAHITVQKVDSCAGP